MILIGPNKNKTAIYGSPAVGSYASHLLLKEFYRKHDIDSWRRQVVFNIVFLRKWKHKYGSLICCFCGKEDLIISTPTINNNSKNMATVDHFVPKAEGIDPRDLGNLIVSCLKCNGKKGSKILDLTSLKFIPKEEMESLFDFIMRRHNAQEITSPIITAKQLITT